jgi:hypothetical protein
MPLPDLPGMSQWLVLDLPSFADAESNRCRYRLWLGGVLALYAAAFLAYSETWAYSYDETYHLLAAQLIGAGKRPYLDFCFPQTPLNAYWNAGWMRLLGQSWRVPHFFAALFTIGAVVLIAGFVFRRFPVPGWRLPAALAAGLAIGLNQSVFEYGPLGQPYGICLFALAAAFRISIRAVDRTGPLLPALAGLFAGTAAGSSLLSAAAAPVLLVWMLLCNRAGSRWIKLAGFGIGAMIPWAPVFRLFVLGPKQTWFNLVQYHAFFRKLYWPDTTRHDLEVLTGWIDSGQGLVLGLLAVFGLIFVARRSRWPDERKAEFYLCACLAAALSTEVGLAHPTFPQYFLLAVPFLAVLAMAGLYAISSRVLEPDHPRWPVLLVTALFALGLVKSLHEHREDNTWGLYQRLADKVEQVTPRNALVFANEPIYFLTKRIPPPGLELSYTHEIHLPPAEAALLHILTEADVKRLLQTGNFATAFVDEEEQVAAYGLKDLYIQHVTTDEFSIYWDRKK